MNIKKIAKRLSKIRDNHVDTDYVSEDDKTDLLSLVNDIIAEAQDKLPQQPKNITSYLPPADNDNKDLSSDQRFRLRVMEKTGTGSASIH